MQFIDTMLLSSPFIATNNAAPTTGSVLLPRSLENKKIKIIYAAIKIANISSEDYPYATPARLSINNRTGEQSYNFTLKNDYLYNQKAQVTAFIWTGEQWLPPQISDPELRGTIIQGSGANLRYIVKTIVEIWKIDD